MALNLFRQDIKKIFLLIAFQQNLRSGQKNADFCMLLTNFGKKLLSLHRRQLKTFFIFFCFDFFPLTQATIFVSAIFLPKVSKVKERR